MMTTKYIIEMEHHRINDTDLYYYKGQVDDVPTFDSRKRTAKRYDFEYEAIRDMVILQSIHRKLDTFRVIPIRCRG